MKRMLTYPFLSMQAEIKKTGVPLTDLMRLLVYLLQLFPALGRHVLSEIPDSHIAWGRVPFYESFGGGAGKCRLTVCEGTGCNWGEFPKTVVGTSRIFPDKTLEPSFKDSFCLHCHTSSTLGYVFSFSRLSFFPQSLAGKRVGFVSEHASHPPRIRLQASFRAFYLYCCQRSAISTRNWGLCTIRPSQCHKTSLCANNCQSIRLLVSVYNSEMVAPRWGEGSASLKTETQSNKISFILHLT